ncbi:MAG: outer membrane protein assembly factor BamA [Rhodobacterales bacterium]|nr:MAG: outer membrane protein assembly factor BamA [Rhodobacterales bacterium]
MSSKTKGDNKPAFTASNLLRPVLSAAILGATISGAAYAQSYSFSGVQIDGNQRIEDATILTYAGIARGETVSAARLNDAAQAIRNTGLFESVSVTPRGGTLVIEVVERATINRINVEGNRRLNDEKLLAVISSSPRRVFNPQQAEADAQAMAKAYADSGRINAVVSPKIIRRSDNRVDLVFEVSEGGLTEIQRISFVGNRSFSDRRLRGVLETKQAGILRAIIQRDTYVSDRIGFDRQVLTDFYRSRGYVDFQITNVDVSLSEERDATLITFNVVEGQQFRVGQVDVMSEMPGVDPAAFRRAVRLRSGQVYSPATIDNDIRRLEQVAIRQGVDFLRVDPRVTRDDRGLILNVDYVLTRGPRIFIERIDIEGNTTTLDRVVRNQFRAVEGDPFNPRQIRESAERIRALGYFSNAEVEAREGARGDQVVVDVNVTEQPTGSLSFGANYSTDFGAGLVASFKERNFLGRGQQLNFAISTAKSNRRFNLSFGEPNVLGRNVSFGLDASYATTDNENALYDTKRGRISPSLGFPVSDNGRINLFYAYEYTDITDVSNDASKVIKEEAALGGFGTHSLGYSFSWDTLRSGSREDDWRFRFVFGQELGASEDTRFVRSSASATAQTRVWHEDVTLRATIEGGVFNYLEGDSRVTDRYFMGSNVMRGFQPGGIGPRDADTEDALGGNVFAVARLEAEFPLGLPEEYGVTGGAFVDYGSVWDVGNTHGANVLYDDYTPRAVAGVSLFWKTPVGPLRFNFTEPLIVEDKDETKDFDITISTTF